MMQKNTIWVHLNIFQKLKLIKIEMKRIVVFLFFGVLIVTLPVFAQVQNNNLAIRIIKSDFLKPLGKLSTMFKECIGAGQ